MRGALLALGLTTFAITACTNDNDPAADNEPGTPITATATTDAVSGSGGISRALPAGVSDITMYYPAAEAEGTPLPLTAYAVTDATLTAPKDAPAGTPATALSFKTTDGIAPLFWQGTADKGLKAHDFFLTVKKPDDLSSIPNLSAAAELGNVLWANYTTDGLRSALAFGNLRSRYARLTLIVKPAGARPTLDAKCLTASFLAIPAANAATANSLTDPNGIRKQPWPLAAGGTPTKKTMIDPTNFVANIASKTEYPLPTLAGSVLIAPQAVPSTSTDANLLTLTYDRNGDGKINAPTADPKDPTAEQWTLDLSTVTVTRPEGSPYYYVSGSTTKEKNTAFAYNAGEHITLTLTLNLSDELGAPGIIGISDYEAATADTTFDLDAEEEKQQP